MAQTTNHSMAYTISSNIPIVYNIQLEKILIMGIINVCEKKDFGGRNDFK